MHTKPITKSLMIACLFGVTSIARAETTVLLCFPGGPGSTEQAQPIVDEFLGKLAALAGWSSAKGTYYNDMTQCTRALKDGGAEVVMVPLDVYLAERSAWKLSPVATLSNKETASRYHVVAGVGATLEGLKGKSVVTGLKAGDAFLSRVAFEGKVDVGRDFKLSRAASALRAVKDVAKGKAAAAILDDVQQKALDGLPMAKELKTVLSGPALPGAIVAGIGAAPDKLGEALLAVCKKHAEVCEKMRVTGFERVDSARLTELEKQLAP